MDDDDVIDIFEVFDDGVAEVDSNVRATRQRRLPLRRLLQRLQRCRGDLDRAQALLAMFPDYHRFN